MFSNFLTPCGLKAVHQITGTTGRRMNPPGSFGPVASVGQREEERTRRALQLIPE
jgi:hypothetical protein